MFVVKLLFALLVCSIPSFATIALITNSTTSSWSFVGCDIETVTGAIDTTGATLLTLWIGEAGGSLGAAAENFTDNKGNTWVALAQTGATGTTDGAWWYSYNKAGGALSVGSNHKITSTTVTGGSSLVSLIFYAWSGTFSTATNPFGLQAQGTNPSGSITPAVNNSLVLSGMAVSNFGPPSTCTATGSLTAIVILESRNTSAMTACTGYIVQTSATAFNPTWSPSNSGSPQPTSSASFSEPVSTNAIKSQGFVF